jgi:hypothetical protein
MHHLFGLLAGTAFRWLATVWRRSGTALGPSRDEEPWHMKT